MPQWTIYSRQGCTLCEEMLLELANTLGPAMQVQVIDIQDDAALEAKYGSRIPVLLADGEFVCCYRLDRERVALWGDKVIK